MTVGMSGYGYSYGRYNYSNNNNNNYSKTVTYGENGQVISTSTGSTSSTGDTYSFGSTASTGSTSYGGSTGSTGSTGSSGSSSFWKNFWEGWDEHSHEYDAYNQYGNSATGFSAGGSQASSAAGLGQTIANAAAGFYNAFSKM